MIIYQDDNYRALSFVSRKAQGVWVIFFGHWRADYDPFVSGEFESVDEKNFLTDANLNAIFIQSNKNDWYQSEGLKSLFSSIKSHTSPDDIYIAYGNSMGGTGAILCCSYLDIDYCVATSPQFSIERSFMLSIMDDRWLDCHREKSEINNHTNVSADSAVKLIGSTPLCVFYDSSNVLDGLHVQYLRECHDVKSILCPGTYHHAGKLLQSEYGVVVFLRDLGYLLKSNNNTSFVNSFICSVEAKLQKSLNKEFADIECWENRLKFVERHGFAKMSKLLDPWFIFNEFEQGADFYGAIFLSIMSSFWNDERHAKRVQHLLGSNGFSGLVVHT